MIRQAASAVPAVLLAGCETINVYFPAAAAEKAADRIIDEVWKQQSKSPEKPAEPATEPGTK